MSNVTITQLPQTTGLTGAEYMEAVQGGSSVRTSVAQIAQVVGAIGAPFSQVTIGPPQAGGVTLTLIGADPGPTLSVSSSSQRVGIVVNGTDLATIQVLSSDPTQRSTIVFGQSAGIGRVGADGSNFLLSDSTNGDLCLVSTSQSVRLGTVLGGVTGLKVSGNNVTITGTLGINGNAPPSQSTGWGSPTGASVVNNFSGGSATLAQTSAAVAQLITLLKSFGLLAT